MVAVDAPLPPLRTLVTAQQWADFRYLRLPADIHPPGYAAEEYDVGVLFDQIEAAPPLRPMPLVLTARGEPEPLPDPLPPGPSADTVAAFNRAGPQGQADFAASVPGAGGRQHATHPMIGSNAPWRAVSGSWLPPRSASCASGPSGAQGPFPLPSAACTGQALAHKNGGLVCGFSAAI
jgi:hypothetical protein